MLDSLQRPMAQVVWKEKSLQRETQDSALNDQTLALLEGIHTGYFRRLR